MGFPGVVCLSKCRGEVTFPSFSTNIIDYSCTRSSLYLRHLVGANRTNEVNYLFSPRPNTDSVNRIRAMLYSFIMEKLTERKTAVKL